MSDTVYRWNPDTAIESVWEAVQVEPLRQDLIRDGVLVPVERCEHGNIDPHREYEKMEEGPFGPLYELAVICPGSPTLVEADDGW